MEITQTDIESILGMVRQIFTDILPLTILIIGLFVGFWVIKNVISLAVPTGFGEDEEDEEEEELSDEKISGFFSRLRDERGKNT